MEHPSEPVAGKHPMKAVARLTGLPADTIRAWERRYGAIAPERAASSHRLYSDEEVERLRLLRRVVDGGHAIGRVARLPLDELAGLAAGVAPAAPAEAGPQDVVARVLEALRRYDTQAADRELSRIAALLPARRVVLEVAQPLLRDVGHRWETGELNIAQEHVLSGLLRSLLGTLLRLADPPAGRPPLVLATLPGERHELGLLMVALLAASAGVPVCFLGTDVPPEEIANVVRQTGAAAVGISLVYQADAARMLLTLRERMPARAQLWLGGREAVYLPPASLPAGVRLLVRLDELEAALATLA